MKNTEKRSDHQVTKIADKTYMINEFNFSNCYLVEGDEKALLIDTGLGIGSIKKCAESLTDLPMTVAATHAHLDHVGGAGQFSEVYVHKADINFRQKMMRRYFFRKKFFNMIAKRGDMPVKLSDLSRDEQKPKFIPMEDGHVFHLGGRDIKVMSTPGHTEGCVVLIDDKEKIAFTGDNVNPCLWMHMPDGISLEWWQKGAKATIELVKTHTPYCGHADGVLTLKMIEDLYAVSEKIMSDHPENTSSREAVTAPDKETYPQIVYSPHRIWEKK